MQQYTIDFQQLAVDIKHWGRELGFQQVGIADVNLATAERHLQNWVEKGYHGDMAYMQKHGTKRSRPSELLPGTLRVISARMDYLPADSRRIANVLADKNKGYISRYALGRDYHKVMKKRLQKLADKINTQITALNYRAFVDSAPVLEKALAEKAGLGWIGKHTLVINKQAGSWFFLGEIFINIPLPIDTTASNHCGSCTACINICPTKAIIGPYQLDARRCISYLTIELKSAIPLALRPLIGNRIFGCDDCQLICPWNKFAHATTELDFLPRHQLGESTLLKVFAWSEEQYHYYTEGSALRRTGYECWLRNIAVALGNSQTTPQVISALQQRLSYPSELVQEHVKWALAQHDLLEK